MTNITGVGFTNFRVFQSSTFFKFAPITILTGTNSSGKSSVFKGLKLLNNNAGNLENLNFSGEGHKLGNFKLAKSKESDSDKIRFILEVDNKSLLVVDYYSAKSSNNEHGYWNQLFLTKDTEVKNDYLDSDLILKLAPVDEYEPYMKSYLNIDNLLSIDNSSGIYSINTEQNHEHICIISPEALINLIPTLNAQDAMNLATEMQRLIFGKFAVRFIEMVTNDVDPKDKTIIQYLQEVKRQLKFVENATCYDYFKDTSIDAGVLLKLDSAQLTDIISGESVKKVENKINDQVDSLIVLLDSGVRNINYLESIRANSQRLYSNQSQGTAFNELLIGLESFWSRKTKRDHHLLQFADKWLSRFGIGDKIIINRFKDIATEVIIERDGLEVDLIDLGYGATQFVPILLTVCSRLIEKQELRRVPVEYLFEDSTGNIKDYQPNKKTLARTKGPLLLIEEPESNLHPKLQSLLADFFVDVAQTYEVTVLIETHSEYLIRRLQVLTAKREVKPEDSVIYYIDGNMPNSYHGFVRKINIEPDGSLTNEFGTGFIDEATNWKIELMRLKNSHLYNSN